ncbi:MAG: reverse transcriptase-like protein [Lachnospiraceae bacterium]|nr:reverse transcriptase-like protein [Lachnospiraceae bacterium]
MNRVIAYVDGSYQDAIKTYAYGCVVFTPEGEVYCRSDRGSNPDTAAIRNVAGEMLGAMTAVQWAMKSGYPAIEIRYDYQGIEMWATGRWKTKNELTRKYAETMQNWGRRIGISYKKIKSHSGDRFNDMADRLAKEALLGQVLEWELAPEQTADSGSDDTGPLLEALEALRTSGCMPFHMPGHKRKPGVDWGEDVPDAGGGEPSLEEALDGAAFYDITEIDGFDNLHDAEGILRAEMEAMARFYGTQSTHILVNGSTCGILAAISAAVPYGGTILMERGCHISAYHAAYLRDLSIRFAENMPALSPDRPDSSAPGSLKPDAVIITSPTYEGCVKNISGWADYAHKTGAVLIVDEAHGAHLPFLSGRQRDLPETEQEGCPDAEGMHFPKSAIAEGADLVIQSTHKTLPSLTQTALLHNVTGRVPDGSLEKFLRIYESSSPSYILMASVARAFHWCVSAGKEAFRNYAENIRLLRRELASLQILRLAGGEEAYLSRDGEIPPYHAKMELDPGKLVILTDGAGKYAAADLYDCLRLKYHIQPEMKAPGYVLFMTSVADTREDFKRLADALLAIDAAMADAGGHMAKAEDASRERNEKEQPKERSLGEPHVLPRSSCPLREAYDAPSEDIPVTSAKGRVSAGFVILYPPDVPVIIPGETFDETVIGRIRQLQEDGFSLTGIDTENRVSVILK